ncbi:MAG: hypothetical protein WCT47_22850, partial [Betaproteobacteria bacterium]
ANLRNAYAELFKNLTGNTPDANAVQVTHRSLSAGEQYTVRFAGALGQQDLPAKGISIASTTLDWTLSVNGANALTEQQLVVVDRAADTEGTFGLSLTHAGKTWTTAPIALGATPAQVQDALRAATATGATGTLGTLGTIDVSGQTDRYSVSFDGALSGTNLAALKPAALQVNAQLPEGSFQISYVNEQGDRVYSPAIAYSANAQTLRANLQAALDTLYGGTARVAVSVDEAQTEGRRATFVLNFQGTLARTDIADITTHFGSTSELSRNLSLAVVKPSNLAQGEPRTGEVQRITVQGQAATPAWTLSLTHATKTATSQTINADMTREEVQARVDAMMAALNTAIGNGFAASATVEFWSGRVLELRFAGSLAGVDVAALQVTDVPRPETATLSVQQDGSTTVIAAVPERTLVVDYATGKTELEVRNGPEADDTFELTMDGSRGQLLEVRGNLTLDVFGFVQLSGEFALEKSTDEVVVAGEDDPATTDVDESSTRVTVDKLTIGASGVKAFAGIGGGTAGRVGLQMGGDPTSSQPGDVSFALAILGEQRTGLEPAGYELRRWTSLQAQGSAAFVGVD